MHTCWCWPAGKYKDPYSQEFVDCSKTIFLLTTNAADREIIKHWNQHRDLILECGLQPSVLKHCLAKLNRAIRAATAARTSVSLHSGNEHLGQSRLCITAAFMTERLFVLLPLECSFGTQHRVPEPQPIVKAAARLAASYLCPRLFGVAERRPGVTPGSTTTTGIQSQRLA